MDSTILGVLGLVGSIASLMGIGLYQLFFRDTPLRMLIVGTTVFGALIGSTGIILYTHYNRQLGIPDKVFLITDNVVVSAVGQISQMPVTSACGYPQHARPSCTCTRACTHTRARAPRDLRPLCLHPLNCVRCMQSPPAAHQPNAVAS
jgi:hypothetical protein